MTFSFYFIFFLCVLCGERNERSNERAYSVSILVFVCSNGIQSVNDACTHAQLNDFFFFWQKQIGRHLIQIVKWLRINFNKIKININENLPKSVKLQFSKNGSATGSWKLIEILFFKIIHFFHISIFQ